MAAREATVGKQLELAGVTVLRFACFEASSAGGDMMRSSGWGGNDDDDGG